MAWNANTKYINVAAFSFRRANMDYNRHNLLGDDYEQSCSGLNNQKTYFGLRIRLRPFFISGITFANPWFL